MKTIAILVFTLILATGSAQARMGSSRGSFGSRGSRGFGGGYSSGGSPYRSGPTRPLSPQAPQSAPAPARNPYPQSYPQPVTNGGGFMRGMLGGLAGGFLGSMLFRHMGYGMGGYPYGGGGIGLFEVLLLAGIGFLLFRAVISRAAVSGSGEMPYRSEEPAPRITPVPVANRDDAWSAGALGSGIGGSAPTSDPESVLRQRDFSFDARRFKEERMDDFFKIQAAWMHRDLAPVRPLLATEMASLLEEDIAGLKQMGRVNHLENIAVRETELVEAWQEVGRTFATIRFNANLLDYTLDEKTGALVDGSRDTPVKFEEYWTFVAEGSAPSWRLSAVEKS